MKISKTLINIGIFLLFVVVSLLLLAMFRIFDNSQMVREPQGLLEAILVISTAFMGIAAAFLVSSVFSRTNAMTKPAIRLTRNLLLYSFFSGFVTLNFGISWFVGWDWDFYLDPYVALPKITLGFFTVQFISFYAGFAVGFFSTKIPTSIGEANKQIRDGLARIRKKDNKRDQ